MLYVVSVNFVHNPIRAVFFRCGRYTLSGRLLTTLGNLPQIVVPQKRNRSSQNDVTVTYSAELCIKTIYPSNIVQELYVIYPISSYSCYYFSETFINIYFKSCYFLHMLVMSLNVHVLGDSSTS